jgi:alanyl-tRNA synthetase
VGDHSHLTFFEMLGNFSVGDYFKPGAISLAWEFVTQRLALPPERLWATIFLDDDEAFHIWREIGVPETKILRFGEEDNYWGPAGDSGPCGPCSEIHYDFGEEFGCGKASCAPGCDCGRFCEIWNLVFMQYNQDKDGHRTLLPKPNIDTGMGVERTAAVMQGKTSIYETDLFTPLIQRIAELTGREYGSDDDADRAMRVVAEHSRGVAFLIADGVIPSNEGPGYVLRRVLRRAALFGRRLGLDKPFLAETAKATIEQMGHIYPELVQRQDFILKVIEVEEARFEETLSTGLELLDGVMEKATIEGKNKIPGKEAFKLYDTFGFPVELTNEVAAGRGFSVDLDGFEKEMEKQRERAREAQIIRPSGIPSAEAFGMLSINLQKIPFVGYQNLQHKSNIVSLLVDNKPTETVEEGQEASLILDTTPFYGEMGGQVGDTGQIISPSGKFSVTNTVRVPPDITVHQGQVAEGRLLIGETVEAVVDEERRFDIARNHTATHLLQLALRRVLGEHVQQRGSLVAPDRFRFDFSHLMAMTEEEIQEVQRIVNEKIRQNLAVYGEETPYKKAIEEGAIALFDEKYGDVVRVVKIDKPAISTELCGGTHLSSTGEIGLFHIIDESSIGAGLRRIEAVTGRGAEAFIDQRLSDLQKTADYLDAEVDSVLDKAYSLVIELDKERKRAQVLERELSKKIAESLLSQAEVINGVTVLAARVPSLRLEALREMSDLLRDKLKSAVVVLGTVYEDKPTFLAVVTPDLVSRGYNAGEIVKQVAKVAGGGGGGRATFAQAGGKYKNKLDEALQLVRSLI